MKNFNVSIQYRGSVSYSSTYTNLKNKTKLRRKRKTDENERKGVNLYQKFVVFVYSGVKMFSLNIVDVH